MLPMLLSDQPSPSRFRVPEVSIFNLILHLEDPSGDQGHFIRGCRRINCS